MEIWPYSNYRTGCGKRIEQDSDLIPRTVKNETIERGDKY
ncbi:MAG: hypothetical protein JWM11_2469 [Planctomycetaceae bacterium]|nr:hypothetical protein [Planctomycetaceae bacterium]